jgi:hypothetical protein
VKKVELTPGLPKYFVKSVKNAASAQLAVRKLPFQRLSLGLREANLRNQSCFSLVDENGTIIYPLIYCPRINSRQTELSPSHLACSKLLMEYKLGTGELLTQEISDQEKLEGTSIQYVAAESMELQ